MMEKGAWINNLKFEWAHCYFLLLFLFPNIIWLTLKLFPTHASLRCFNLHRKYWYVQHVIIFRCLSSTPYFMSNLAGIFRAISLPQKQRQQNRKPNIAPISSTRVFKGATLLQSHVQYEGWSLSVSERSNYVKRQNFVNNQ